MKGNSKVLVIDDEPSLHADFLSVLGADDARGATTALDSLEASIFEGRTAPVRHTFDLFFSHQGEEGVNLARVARADGSPFAVAFVDMRMPPGWDGLRTVQELWAVDPQVQVVICTAHADYSWDAALRQLEARDRQLIVKKPVDPVEVWQAASMLSAKWSLAREAESKFAELERTLRECLEALAALTLSQPDHLVRG
jgi:CheY-like chemotaxis protein